MRALLLFLGICLSFLVYAEIQIEVEPKEVDLESTFRLTLISKQSNTSMGLPNLTPLNENFFILGTERSLSYSIINGKTESISQWIILLKPKKTGTLSIPSLHVGQEESPSASVVVVETQTKVSSENPVSESRPHIYLESQVDEVKPLLNQQILYTVKLFTNKPIANAHYEPPTAEDALVIPLGEGKRYETKQQEHPYAVEEQRYAIFPQKSGSFKITSPSFQAILFGIDDTPIQVTGKPTILNVQPIPSSEKNHFWLPAHNVSLSETYENKPNVIKQNDTLNRIITLKAEAMPAQLLPTIPLEKNKNYQAYAELPDIQNQIKEQVLTGQSTIKITYIFNTAGHITLPEITIPWYNITTHQPQIARLPSFTVEVLPNPSTSTSSNPPRPAIPLVTSSKNPSPISLHFNIFSDWKLWLIISIMLFGLIFVTRIYLRYIPRTTTTLKKALYGACVKNQPQQASQILITWAQYHWPDNHFFSLQDVIKKIHDPALKKELQKLFNALYNPTFEGSWTGAALWKYFTSYRLRHSTRKHSRILPPINPPIL